MALSDLERFLHETDLPLLIQLAIVRYQFEDTGRERRRIYEAPRTFEGVYGSIDVEDPDE